MVFPAVWVAAVTVTLSSPTRFSAANSSIWRNSPVMVTPKSVVATRTLLRPQSLTVVVLRLTLTVMPPSLM